ncbi:MAG: ABC transporter permease [Verrucomicrobia bacterium]|nr:ABC transporter permease [Verrucomicrobiota bacterium]
MTAEATASRPSRSGLRWGRLLLSDYAVLVLSAGWFVGVMPLAPGFATWENLANLVGGMLPLLVVATGQTLVLITGGIDLSVTSTIALASVVGARVMSGDSGWLGGSVLAVPAGVAAMLAVGAAVGGLNGAAVTVLRMPPFIVTLTTMMFVSGFAIWWTQSRNIGGLPAGFVAIGARTLPALLVALGVAGAAHAVLTRSLAGRWAYAIGHNPRAAFISGVPVRRVTLLVYVACGCGAAVASVLYTGRLEAGSPVHGQRILLDVIGAAVLGGTSLFGGRGTVVGTAFGVLFLGLLDNSLNLLNLSHFTIMMTKGAVILVAAWMDTVRRRLDTA